MLDIDHFKKVNDNFGHLRGDMVLKDIANIMKANTREADLVGRWGGEEFLVICTATDLKDLFKLAETIRKEIEQYIFDEASHITVSLGVATVIKNDNRTSLLDRADKALYEAKETGRNRVCSQ